MTPKIQATNEGTEVYCVQYSPDGSLLGVGCGDGNVRLYSPTTGKVVYTLNALNKHMPITCIRYRPNSGVSKTRNVLLVASMIDY